jgi:hypothetical protein
MTKTKNVKISGCHYWCPSCGQVMLDHYINRKDLVLECFNSKCTEYEIKYIAPDHIRLKRFEQ